MGPVAMLSLLVHAGLEGSLVDGLAEETFVIARATFLHLQGCLKSKNKELN